MLTAKDVADFFLSSIDSEPDGESISNLKLQKLLYYAQGTALSVLGRALFIEPIFNWRYGPVVPSVYYQYNQHGSSPLPRSYIEPEKYSQEEIAILSIVRREYGQFSAWKLRDMTHQESPWLSTLNGAEITLDIMKSFFIPKKEIGFDFDLGRMKERVEGVFIQLPESVQSDDDFVSWVSAQ